MADVIVYGLVGGTHVLEDIRMDVPQGATVAIPAEKAAISKDLYRAISQKRILLIPRADGQPQNLRSPSVVHDDVLQMRCQTLELRNKQLEEEIVQLREALQTALSQQERLDNILAAIGQIHIPQTNGTSQVGSTGPVVAAPQEIADGSAPAYIPSEIMPKDASTRIDTVTHESTSVDVAGTVSALRKMRGKQ